MIACPTAWAQGPVGPEFQVNSYTTGYQTRPAVASDANGNFVVVWSSSGQDGSSDGVFGQRFNSSGLPQGSEFQVNSYTTAGQNFPHVASDAAGNFVVVWMNWGQDGTEQGLFGRRFDPSGVPLGSEFQVNEYTTGRQSMPAVASDANGNFVVVWSSYGQDGSAEGIFGRRFNASGLPQGLEFQANSYTFSSQEGPVVASDASGNFVVLWQSYSQDGRSFGIFGQRFNASGVPQGVEFLVNSYTTGSQSLAAVASDANGNFVVVWESDPQDGSFRRADVFAQRFEASGVRLGGEFQVNSYTEPMGPLRYADVASDPNGNFVVVWPGYLSRNESSEGIFGRSFNASGLPQGRDVSVNSYTTGTQARPAVASDASGNFVVVWSSLGQDGSGWGVFGQRFGDLIFKDGFQ